MSHGPRWTRQSNRRTRPATLANGGGAAVRVEIGPHCLESLGVGGRILNRTFIHAQGIGATLERKLWANGFPTWDDCLSRSDCLPLGAATRKSLIRTLEESAEALSRRNAHYFARTLPPREHWRAAREFSRVGFLDIETNGGSTVTVIGLYDGNRVRQYIRGDNMDEFPEEVAGYDMLVTFFGGGFDIPMLRRAFPRLPFDALHLDLCPALRRLGYKGGLKSIERQLGLSRSNATTGLSGWDAVRLWQEYQSGSEEALSLLLAYNAEDIVNLEPLLDVAYEGLYAQAITNPDPSHSL